MATMIDKMLDRHYRILDLCLSGTMTQEAIAKEVGVTSATVRNIIASPTFQHEIAMRRRARAEMTDEIEVRDITDTVGLARERIAEKALEAAMRVTQLINSIDDRTALAACESTLDRAGIPRVTKSEQSVKGSVLVLDAADLLRLESSLQLAFSNNECKEVKSLTNSDLVANKSCEEAGAVLDEVGPPDHMQTQDSPPPHDPPRAARPALLDETLCLTRQALTLEPTPPSAREVGTL